MVTEMLALATTDPSAGSAVTRIASFTRRMTRMVEQVMDLTRTRIGGGIPLALRDVRLGALAKTVVKELALAHPQSRFELEVVDDVHGAWDHERLAQVLAAVLGNAVQHGLRDGVVTISVAASSSGAAITVTNDLRDEPIPPDALETLFAAYHRGWDQKHAGPGLGLDLYIAQEIIHAHGGSISAESSRDGTTIRIVLPEKREQPRG
ncbi:MAG: HAMP domain-containing histidine kinase [Myxococcota bacterium]|nr:HAMP domain-containing histidine kinase [Myxococcota bacterium]